MNYNEQEIMEAFENGTLFVKCLNTVEDDIGVYNIEGNEYEVVGEEDDCWGIECETDENGDADGIRISKDDKDFELIIKS